MTRAPERLPDLSGRQRTVVLDDDPTGTQEITNAPVLLRRNRIALVELLQGSDTVYVLTNTRAVSEGDAKKLLDKLRLDVAFAEESLGIEVLVVQRGDSTLRGHVFAEIDVFAHAESVVVFAPAFPAGGRLTSGGVHRVLVDGMWINAADTEFATDPVFGFSERTMVDYVQAKGSRSAVSTQPANFLSTALATEPGTVIVPDAESNSDLEEVARDIRTLVRSGRSVVVRCAAPLAAYLAGRKSTGFIDLARVPRSGPVLVVAGSHTAATTRQIEAVLGRWPSMVEIDTDAALADPDAAGALAAARVREAFLTTEVVILATERVRRAEHGSLGDAARVMQALSSAVTEVRDVPGVVIAKGGITSAEIARSGFGAKVGWVQGQVEPGISLWKLGDQDSGLPYIVVPGNIGDADTIVRLVTKLVNR